MSASPPTHVAARHDFELNLRPTGIGLMGEMPWGTHICVFYETKADLLDALVSYFGAGLQNNEYCMLVVSEPITAHDATSAFAARIPNFERYANQIEIVPGTEWYLKGGRLDIHRVAAVRDEKVAHALASGHEGLRASGNAFWLESTDFRDFTAYEHELDRSVAGHKTLVMCTYSLHVSQAITVLDVVRAHHFTVARRHSKWETLETPELGQSKREFLRLNGALGVLSNRFCGHSLLTQRERLVLAHTVTGASSKEVARRLGISPRTVEFHRANIMRKLGAKNTVDLVRKVLREIEEPLAE